MTYEKYLMRKFEKPALLKLYFLVLVNLFINLRRHRRNDKNSARVVLDRIEGSEVRRGLVTFKNSDPAVYIASVTQKALLSSYYE